MEKFNSRLSSIVKIPELRERIIFTLLMFLVARVGTLIPAPGVDVDRLSSMASQSDVLSYINMFSGGAFTRISIFSLGIIPYINASIVVSLLVSIIPQLEEIQKEGESGRNRITQWTRYLTIALAIIQGAGVCLWLQSVGLIYNPGLSFFVRTITTLTAGTVFLMWVGEQISIKGIGNGVSLIIFLNVISRAPSSVIQTIQTMQGNKFLIPLLVLVAFLGTVTIAGIVLFQLGQRKIPIHYVGKGFTSKGGIGVSIKTTLSIIFGQNHPVYMIMYALVIMFFSFFYTALVFDPEKVAENLKQGGGTIPGIRPGEETVEYLEGVASRITWGGGLFLAIISILPYVIFTSMEGQE